MIGYIQGRVIARGHNYVTVQSCTREQVAHDVHRELPAGHGYDILTGALQNLTVGTSVELFCWYVGGDDPKLFGFTQHDDKELAIAIAARTDGVGPTTAHRLVTSAGAGEVYRLIAARDAKAMAQRCKGLGPKSAEKIIGAMGDLARLMPGISGRDFTAALNTLKALGIEITPRVTDLLDSSPADAAPNAVVAMVLAGLR